MATAKRTTSPAFQFYPKDFLSSDKVDRMSMTERGIYITLMSRYWLDGDLPLDLKELAGMVRMKAKQFERLWTNGKLHLCFVERDGRLVQRRLEAERRKQAEYRRRQSDHGERGGRPKRVAFQSEKGSLSPNSETGKGLESSSSASAFAVSSLQTPVVPTARPSPIISRRRKDAAFEYGRLYVPQRAHDDLMMLGNHGQEKALLDWYEAICEDYTNGAKANTSLPTDLIAFWKARYAERWPAETLKKAVGRYDNWTPR